MKGLSTTLGLAIVAFFAVALVMNIGIERVAGLEERISLNTVDLVSQRVEIAAYGLDSAEEGSYMEIELEDKYNLTEDGEVAYEFNSYLPGRDEVNYAEIDPPDDVNFRVEAGEKSKYFCLRKPYSTVQISTGEC